MLILASASPRRRELLTQAGYQFQIHPANIPEDPHPGEDPIAYVSRLARQKAEAVYHQLADPTAVVLGSDTTVTIEDPLLGSEILGKPENAEDAARMLRLLSGRTHRVITGISLVYACNEKSESESTKAALSQAAHVPNIANSTAAEVTAVQFLNLSEADIANYIATGEPNDKAGAYAIQGHAARWIPRIEGCYYNVMGLPISRVATMLANLPITANSLTGMRLTR
jgi:septum formation protein